MASQILLRDYRADDLEAMYALDLVCFEPQFRFSRSTMKRFVERSNAGTVIAEVDRELVGFGIVHVELAHGGRVGYVMTLDVAPKQRRRGVAEMLMRQMENDAVDVGCSAMVLHVFDGNSVAIRFYERMGYAFSRTAKDFYGAGMDALVYIKQLPGAI